MHKFISIDIGTKNIKIILVSKSENKNSFKILSKKSYPSAGVSFGYINNSSLFSEALKKAVRLFERETDFKIEEAFFSINGYGVKGENKKISTQTEGGIITDFEQEETLKKAIYDLKKTNKDDIIEKINIKTIIDDFEHFSDSTGLHAKKFEQEFMFITQKVNSNIILEESLSNIDIEILGQFPALISSAEFSLSDLDKKLGCMLLDIGDETTSFVIYDNNKPVYYNVLKGGSKKITESVSLSEKISFEKAEHLKTGKIIGKKIENIFDQELEILSKKILDEIKKSGKETILPGGITIVGGGAKLLGIEKSLREKITMPVKKSSVSISDSDSDYHSAYGNVLLGTRTTQKQKIKIKNIFNQTKNLIKKLAI